ncbi:MAG: ester cyclase [Bacteroidota bacterium]
MKETVEKYVAIWNSNDIANLEEILSEKSDYWDATQAGDAKDVLKNAVTSTYNAFSDISFEIVSLKADGKNQFFLEWQMTGTNTGSFFGYPPTGKYIKIPGLDSIKIESGKISKIKSFYDSSLFMQQLGLQ